MIKTILLLICLLSFQLTFAQKKGEVVEIKDPLIDSLIAKRIELNLKKVSTNGPVKKAIFTGVGYRVQIFYGANRKEVFNQQSKFRALYPKIMSYISYREPNYRLKVGDFRTKAEAQTFLKELRANFPTLFIFKEKINAPILEEVNK